MASDRHTQSTSAQGGRVERGSSGRAGTSVRGRLTEAMRACRRAFLAVLLCSLCISLLMLTAPIYMLHLSDHVLTSRSTDTLLMLTGIALFALLTFGVLEVVRRHITLEVGRWLDINLGEVVFSECVQSALRTAAAAPAQGLRDLATLRSSLTGPAIIPVLDAPWMPIFVAVIFTLHPSLGWISVGGAAVLLALGVTNEFMTRGPLERAGTHSMKVLAKAEASIRNADSVEAMGMTPALAERWSRDNRGVLDMQMRAGFLTSYFSAASKVLRFGLQVAVLGMGAWLVLQAEITPGVMIAASILMTRALGPVEQVIASYKTMISARSAYARLRLLLKDVPPEGAMALPEPQGRLAAEGILYAHPGSTNPLLRDITFALEPGEALGLVGPSGSGKTTLARLLVGNLHPRSGHVRLDVAEVSKWASDDRGRYVGYLPQDVELFPGSVRENIARMSQGSPEAVVEAARLAGVHELILRLPEGYETQILESATNLSGGEQQRIALARALFGSPRLVVLDEPNANLDGAGEEALLAMLGRLRERRITCIIISHRPNILRHVDRILVLRDGQIAMCGEREEVLARVTVPVPVPGTPAAVPVPTQLDVAAHGGHHV